MRPAGENGTLPDGWRMVRLGDVCTLQRGIDLPVQNRTSGAIPVYGSNGVLDYHSKAASRGPGVITGRSGSIGRVYYSEGPYWPLNTTLYVRDFHGNHERYIYHLLSHLGLERFSASTGVPSLNRNFVHPHLVAIPILAEQQAIAAVLDSIDEAIEVTEAVIAITEQLRDSLLHELLTRGVPGWHTGWREALGIGTIPADWKVVRLGEVSEVAFSGVDKRKVEGEEPIQLCNYTDVFYNRRIRPRMSFMSATATHAERERFSLKQGDVLFTKDSETPDEIGVPTYVTEDMLDVLCGYHLALARPYANRVDGAFLAETLRSAASQREFSRIANGVTRFGLTLGATRSMLIALPLLAEQQAIASLLDAVDNAIERGQAEREGLQSLKTSAADVLLTGRVRVSIGRVSQDT